MASEPAETAPAVKTGALSLYTAFFREVCGNHIVWSARGVETIRVRHVGDVMARYRREFFASAERWADPLLPKQC